jgi:interferon gamma-inducible protein 30
MADIRFVPFGNASIRTGSSGTWEFLCQHGDRECQWNQIETCALKLIPDLKTQFDFINCIEESNSAAGTLYDNTIVDCAMKTGNSQYTSSL